MVSEYRTPLVSRGEKELRPTLTAGRVRGAEGEGPNMTVRVRLDAHNSNVFCSIVPLLKI
jgi:hypothetical protein